MTSSLLYLSTKGVIGWVSQRGTTYVKNWLAGLSSLLYLCLFVVGGHAENYWTYWHDMHYNVLWISINISFWATYQDSYEDSNCTTSWSLCSTWKPDNDASAPLAAWIAWSRGQLFQPVSLKLSLYSIIQSRRSETTFNYVAYCCSG